MMLDFNTVLMHDALKHLCGDKIGSGAFRDVYVYAPDTTKVIKVAKDAGGIEHNMAEHLAFLNMRFELRDYFAYIHDCSQYGTFLIQDRVDPLPTIQAVTCELPKVSDMRRDNVGYNEQGKVVIIDIGFGVEFGTHIDVHVCEIPYGSIGVEYNEVVERKETE